MIASAAHWYAVWTHSQCETRVAEGLERRGFDVYLPRVRMPSRRRDRRIVLRQPLFPGYVFLHFDSSREDYLRAAGTEGVVRILGDRWDALWTIPEEQVQAVRRVVNDGDGARAVAWVRVGDRARIVAGPLAGLEGVVSARHSGRATFVVNVDLLQRSVAVEIDPLALERL